MKFCEIVNDLMDMKPISRRSWSDGSYIRMEPGKTINVPSNTTKLISLANINVVDGEIVTPQILMKYKPNENTAFESSLQSEDLCADDWFVMGPNGCKYVLCDDSCLLSYVIKMVCDRRDPGKYAFRHKAWSPKNVLVTMGDSDTLSTILTDGYPVHARDVVRFVLYNGYELYERVSK